jgi:hypothetical protein
MKLPVFSADDFIAFLKLNGVDVVSNEFFDDHNRLVLRKDNYTFPLQFRESYFYPLVCKICDDLGIEAPAQHRRNYDQHIAMLQKSKSKNEADESE